MKKEKHKFVVSHHKAVKEYGLEAEPSDKEFKVTDINGIKTAMVPKRFLGVNKLYQRPLKKSKVKHISANFSNDIYDFASVYHSKVGKMNFYQITNGQHRVCAYPGDEVPCRIVNTLAPCTRFLQANDPRSVSPLKRDEIFWAKVYEAKTTKNRDPEGVLTAIKAFKHFGYKPGRDVTGEMDFGSKVSTVHYLWTLYTHANYKKLKLPATAYKRKCTENLYDALNIITEVFGLNTFSRLRYQSLLWGAMFDWLTHEKYMGGKYAVKDVINQLSKGRWAVNGAYNKKYNTHRKRARKEVLVTLDDWKKAVIEYQTPNGRRHNEWLSLIDDTFAVSSQY
jgi:hypothetical protein|tara:strand:- start:6040 stop:7050 length:1011 start_codon:yes stop_codon:yes gene_type:complete